MNGSARARVAEGVTAITVRLNFAGISGEELVITAREETLTAGGANVEGLVEDVTRIAHLDDSSHCGMLVIRQ